MKKSVGCQNIALIRVKNYQQKNKDKNYAVRDLKLTCNDKISEKLQTFKHEIDSFRNGLCIGQKTSEIVYLTIFSAKIFYF